MTGKAVAIYGQTELTRDPMEAREAAGASTVYEPLDVRLEDFDSGKPRVSLDSSREVECDLIAGCDGFHGVCRASVRGRSFRALR